MNTQSINSTAPLSLTQAIGQKLMFSFKGLEPSTEILTAIKEHHLGGLTLFRANNTKNPAQVRQLTQALQAAATAANQPPLLIGTDQEGGQLMAIDNGPTRFPGNMALGAIRSADLSYQVGYALGLELAAMGVNVNYAPICDVNSNPQNPVIGTRSFGEDPALVAPLSAAMIKGLQKAGVAATAKHFPGHGDTASDSHHGTPIITHNADRLQQVELPPFQAAIEAGTRLIMSAHIALPALNNGATLPSTLSPKILKTLLREEMGFEGVVISDAMDMGAIEQGLGLVIDSIAAAIGGIDLLLFNNDADTQEMVYKNLCQAADRRIIASSDLQESANRILALKDWVASQTQPSLDVVGCAEHQELAQQIANQSITLVRDENNLLPLKLSSKQKILVITPQPADLTPADTSSYITCTLAEAIRRRHQAVTEITVAHYPTQTEIEDVCKQASDYDLIIIGTINAYAQTEQATLVNKLLKTNIPTITIGLRMPYDLQVYPTAKTYLCTYTILDASMEALAAVLWGEIEAVGQLPVSIPTLYPTGYYLQKVKER